MRYGSLIRASAGVGSERRGLKELNVTARQRRIWRIRNTGGEWRTINQKPRRVLVLSQPARLHGPVLAVEVEAGPEKTLQIGFA